MKNRSLDLWPERPEDENGADEKSGDPIEHRGFRKYPCQSVKHPEVALVRVVNMSAEGQHQRAEQRRPKQGEENVEPSRPPVGAIDGSTHVDAVGIPTLPTSESHLHLECKDQGDQGAGGLKGSRQVQM